MTATGTKPKTELAATNNNSPLAMIDRAQQTGANPEQVEKWMELAERWENREAEKAYARAMHTCQQAMPPIHKGAMNTHTRSTYATLEDVQRSARPVYADHGFSLSFGEEPCPTEGLKRTVCDVMHSDGHTKRYCLDLPIDGVGSQGGKSSMNQVQGCISTTSYGQRRLLCMAFNITLTDEDNDGNGANKSPITEEQAIQLKDIASNIPANQMARFFKVIGVGPGEWENIEAARLDYAKQLLIEKVEQLRREGGQ